MDKTKLEYFLSVVRHQSFTLAAQEHHVVTSTVSRQIAQLEAVDSTRESCCGLIAKMARDHGLRLNPLAAKSLYTGMVTDSGRFRYDSVDAGTLSLASFLREQPFDTESIYRGLYAEDLRHLRSKARFLLKIQISEGGVAYIYTDAREVSDLDMDIFSISRGMVGTMSDIRGVDIWVNFTESDRGVLCELRSSRYNINPIAVKYGGGGHAKASGACVPDRETAMNMLRDLEKLQEDAQ